MPSKSTEYLTRKMKSMWISVDPTVALTSGQAAKLIGVATRTLCKWYEAKKLRGYRLPDSEDRRFYLDDVIKFMSDNGIRVDPRLDPNAEMVCYNCPGLNDKVKTLINGLEFGLYLASARRVRAIFLGTFNGVEAMKECVPLVKRHQPQATIVCIYDESEANQFYITKDGSDLKFISPLDSEKVVDEVWNFIKPPPPNKKVGPTHVSKRKRVTNAGTEAVA